MGDGHLRESNFGLDYELAGYRMAGEWYDCEKDAPFPSPSDWEDIDLVTVNLRPDDEDGFYRNIMIHPDILDPPGGDDVFDIDDVAGQAQDAYGFTSQ